jgi:hypothetical protein
VWCLSPRFGLLPSARSGACRGEKRYRPRRQASCLSDSVGFSHESPKPVLLGSSQAMGKALDISLRPKTPPQAHLRMTATCEYMDCLWTFGIPPPLKEKATGSDMDRVVRWGELRKFGLRLGCQRMEETGRGLVAFD